MPDQVRLPDVPDLAAYRPWFDQTAPWLPALQAICKTHGLNGELERIPEGSAIVFRSGEVMIKLLPPFWAHERALDRLGLQRAWGRLPVRTPEILGEGDLQGWTYLITRRLPGTPLKKLSSQLTPADRIRLARQQGELIAALHQLDISELAGHWPEFVMIQRAGFAATQHRHGLPEGQITAFLSALDQALPSLPQNPEPVFLHSDLTDEHLLFEELQGQWQLTGLLDFGDLMAGCALYELAIPCAFLPHQADSRRALLAGSGLTATAEQLLAVLLLHRFCHLPGLLRQARLQPDPAAFRACYCEV